MTDDEKFNRIAAELELPTGWYAQFLESRAELMRRYPGGFNTALVGQHAWMRLTPEQRLHALPGLWSAYYQVIAQEEHAQRLNAAAADSTTSYLGDNDEAVLNLSLTDADLTDPDAPLIEVDARALHNVLAELDLLRHRLAMTRGEKKNGGGDT